MLTILIIRGATLSGAVEGVRFYMGTVNLSVLKKPSVRSPLSASDDEQLYMASRDI
jgi:SNF family Na+-dependent transporter